MKRIARPASVTQTTSAKTHFEVAFSSLSDLLFVRGGVFQILEIVGIVDLQDEEPTLAEWFAVD